VVLQASAIAGEVAVFLYENGVLSGPVGFSTLGMRIQNEQSGSTSLFAQPMAIEPIPEAPPTEAHIVEASIETDHESRTTAKAVREVLEARMESALVQLAASAEASSTTLRQGHLALLKRWYYRPEVRRSGEIFFPDDEGRWPVKAMLRGVGRVVAKMLTTGNHDQKLVLPAQE
jgi:hypothetical protein